jgi:hypothetical protein
MKVSLSRACMLKVLSLTDSYKWIKSKNHNWLQIILWFLLLEIFTKEWKQTQDS